MFFKQVAVGSLLCGVLSAVVGVAQADNINTSGVACQNYNAGEALDIDRLPYAVRNIASQSRPVICSFPRSPANDGAALPFIVDGNNTGSTTTPCTVTVYTQNGTVEGSKMFTGSGTDWRRTVTFDAGTILSGGYATVLCTLASGGSSQIFGVASVQ
jgi:hypothetical protein